MVEIIAVQDYKHTKKLMWMEVHIYSVKAKSQAGNIWVNQRYNDNIKRPKQQDTLLGILKIYSFCQKIQQRASGPGENAGVM